VAVEATLESGLLIRREMQLDDKGVFCLSFIVTNKGPKNVVPNVWPHPEFWAQGTYIPRFWVERNGTWEPVQPESETPRLSGKGEMNTEGLMRFAVYLPSPRRSIIGTILDGRPGRIAFSYDVNGEWVSLDTFLPQEPLAPGKSCVLRVGYELSDSPPDQYKSKIR
jgi:hypothetical protein